jgi:Holliday junction resolvasome RuvABC endonuclease subunit
LNAYCLGIDPGMRRTGWACAVDGEDEIDNLVLACRTCNQEKGTMEPEKFLQIIKRLPIGAPE